MEKSVDLMRDELRVDTDDEDVHSRVKASLAKFRFFF